MQCPNCGNAIEPNDLFCGECGHKIDRQSQTINSAEKDISNAEANGRRHDSTGSLGEGNETTSNQSDHLSRTNESKQDKHPNEEGKVRDHQHVPEHTTSTQQHQMHQPQSNQHQQPHNNASHTYHNQPQYDQSYSNHQQPQQTSQFSDHAKEVTEESKGFFKSAFASPDQVLKSQQAFSFKLLFSLIIVGLLVVALLLAIVIPSSVGMFETPKSQIIFSVVLGIILFLAVIVGATYGITRLVVRQPITFKKVLSDFVLINSVSVAVLLIALILMFANSFSFGGALFILSILLIVVSGVYMIAKYSANHHTRFSSFYGVIIYIIVFFLFVTIFGESLFNQIFGNLISEFNNLFDGSSIY
ncbi:MULTISPECIES: zinc-ribbon domain-containing protein [Staphylococcus]|uniref:zinc-ribbon domain-containing protein n=1 Tax=Staphylococcus TaxID=1279 RepID=UPI00069EA675|nr:MULTISPECIES: zinc-ribbon domain-containing protein [Staphylococcus]MCH4382737.1 zinc-ribbon domain-containing protein [Staphylococcus haemolyticus]MCH4390321.1 zinc-ribbon domain-containing protein [Staphylococcus haemolyticus]MCI2944188.1 zinc-ribbon domain-containing protein [Staphylococcus haemolyticus]MCI2946318.1 zinc-ribbon domain-containing protein [Staphylococcus haemolyticus]PYE05986.1 zinc ribbon protein [Staphylococcus sp. AtHG25]